MPKPIREQVVVITGASSGIGREVALRFAQEGATVALTARGQEALQEVQDEITRMGGRAISIPADVADSGQVQQVAERTAQEFGRIDTWVNNAAVTLYGSFEDTPLQEFKRIIDVDLMGQVHGAKAALPHLKNTRGTLIGIGSGMSRTPAPLQSAYVAAGHALKGFYDSLRLEQQHEHSGVQVSFLMPGSIDTPFFDHAQTHLGVKPGALPPVYQPRMVADAILHAARTPLRDMTVGSGPAVLAGLETMLPQVSDRTLERLGYTTQYTDQPKPPSGPSSLWQPMPGKGAIRDGFRAVPFDAYTWVRLRPAVQGAVAGLTVAAALALPIAAVMIPIASLRRRR